MRQNPVGNLDSGKLLDRPTAHDVVGLSCEPYVLDFDDRGRLFHTARLPHNGESVSMSEKIEESIRPPPTVQTRILLVYLRDGLANHRWPDRLTSLLGAIARICKLEASFLCSLMIEESPDFVGLQGHVSENNSHLNLSFLDAAGTTDGAFSTAYLQRLGYSDSPSYLPDTLSVASSLVSSFISALHSQHVGPRVSVKGINIPENSANQQLGLTSIFVRFLSLHKTDPSNSLALPLAAESAVRSATRARNSMAWTCPLSAARLTLSTGPEKGSTTDVLLHLRKGDCRHKLQTRGIFVELYPVPCGPCGRWPAHYRSGAILTYLGHFCRIFWAAST